MIYLDSAIVVKLLVRENENDWFSRVLAGHSFDTSELAVAEVHSALLFKERAAGITFRERTEAVRAFQALLDNETIVLLPLNRAIVNRARAIQLSCHPEVPLRTLDALHVATCDLHQIGRMAATDKRRRTACQRLGITLLPDSLDDITFSR